MAEPKVRFKRDDGSSYPAWNDVVLGDISTRVTRKNTNGETDRPLTIASIEGLVDQRTYFGKTIASKDMSGYFLLKNGEYAYNKSYSAGYDYGSIKRLDKYDMGALSTLYICFALNDDQNSDFYDCYFNGLSWYNQMPQICAEGARNHGLLNVSPNDFFKIRLSVPSSKEEQQKISDFLSSVDEVISTSEQEVANLETQKKAVMKKIFSQEVRFKKDDGTDFPDWEDDTLGNHCTFFNGDRGKNYPSTSDYVSEGLPFINAGDLDGKHISEKCAKISEEKYNQLGGAKLARNDILYCLRGSLGKMGIVDFDTGGTVASSLVAIRAKDVDYLYMYYFLGSPLEYEQRKVNDEGLAQPNLSAKNVGGYVMPIPCLEEQRLIADFLSDFDEAIAAAKKELELWKELKKGLLQQMFV